MYVIKDICSDIVTWFKFFQGENFVCEDKMSTLTKVHPKIFLL